MRSKTNIQFGGMYRFLAPELLQGDGEFRTTKESDVFSLGMLLYHLLYGVFPFHTFSDPAAGHQTMSGRTPIRMRLPDERTSDPAWDDLERQLWPVLMAAWSPKEGRIGLDTLQIAVSAYTPVKRNDDLQVFDSVLARSIALLWRAAQDQNSPPPIQNLAATVSNPVGIPVHPHHPHGLRPEMVSHQAHHRRRQGKNMSAAKWHRRGTTLRIDPRKPLRSLSCLRMLHLHFVLFNIR